MKASATTRPRRKRSPRSSACTSRPMGCTATNVSSETTGILATERSEPGMQCGIEAPIPRPYRILRTSTAGLIALLLRPAFEGNDQVKLGMPWQMRNVNLPRRIVAIELCEIFIVRRDDHCMGSHTFLTACFLRLPSLLELLVTGNAHGTCQRVIPTSVLETWTHATYGE